MIGFHLGGRERRRVRGSVWEGEEEDWRERERRWARRGGGGKRGEDRGVKFCKDIGRF